MRNWINAVNVLTESRRVIEPNGCRFMLNPSRVEYKGFFSSLHGAAFICIGDDVSFGAGEDGSIDHSTTAQAFHLVGDERFRGYIKNDTLKAYLEVWVDAETAEQMTDAERAKVKAASDAAKQNACLNRIASSIGILVFSFETGQDIEEHDALLERQSYYTDFGHQHDGETKYWFINDQGKFVVHDVQDEDDGHDPHMHEMGWASGRIDPAAKTITVAPMGSSWDTNLSQTQRTRLLKRFTRDYPDYRILYFDRMENVKDMRYMTENLTETEVSEYTLAKLGREDVKLWLAPTGIDYIMKYGTHDQMCYGHGSLRREGDPEDDDAVSWMARAFQAGWIRASINRNGTEMNVEFIPSGKLKKSFPSLELIRSHLPELETVYADIIRADGDDEFVVKSDKWPARLLMFCMRSMTRKR